MVVDLGILQQGLHQFLAAVEAGGFDDVGDAAVERPACALHADRFHHAIGLWASGRDEAVFDVMAPVEAVEDMTTGGLALAGGTEAVGELLTPSLGGRPLRSQPTAVQIRSRRICLCHYP